MRVKTGQWHRMLRIGLLCRKSASVRWIHFNLVYLNTDQSTAIELEALNMRLTKNNHNKMNMKIL